MDSVTSESQKQRLLQAELRGTGRNICDDCSGVTVHLAFYGSLHSPHEDGDLYPGTSPGIRLKTHVSVSVAGPDQQ